MAFESTHYVGRFAPSPTGPLHFGSLISAIASYLDAKAHNGKWLVRIEDIDPPREPPGASQHILQQLSQHGLQWDDEVLYQSQRSEAYRAALQQLKTQQRLYPCTCSRHEIKLRNGNHGPRCRDTIAPPSEPHAWRVSIGQHTIIEFNDRLHALVGQDLYRQGGDFVLLRKDDLFAYQLAVTVDDHYQGITHVVRGYDLLDSTPRQIFLQQLLGYSTPNYCHTPIVITQDGNKLSKQNLAPSIDNQPASANLSAALQWLKLPLPKALYNTACVDQLAWAVEHWSLAQLKGYTSAVISN